MDGGEGPNCHIGSSGSGISFVVLATKECISFNKKRKCCLRILKECLVFVVICSTLLYQNITVLLTSPEEMDKQFTVTSLSVIHRPNSVVLTHTWHVSICCIYRSYSAVFEGKDHSFITVFCEIFDVGCTLVNSGVLYLAGTKGVGAGSKEWVSSTPLLKKSL